MTITIDVPPDLEAPLEHAAQIRGSDVRSFLIDSARMRLRKDSPYESDAQLLQTINIAVADETRYERDSLLDEQSRRTLTQEEMSRLTNLIDEMKLANAERWRAIGDLARRRGLTLDEMAAQLDIPLR